MKKKQAKQNKPSSNKQANSSTKLPQINNKQGTHIVVSQNTNPNISSYQDEGLVTLIQEYLLKNNLFDTLQIFQKDCIKGFKQSVKSIEVLKKDLITAFDTGNREQFFGRFSQYVPLLMRTNDNKTLKMEFYIQLYFFIYGIHPYLGKKKTVDVTAKQHFVSYLQGRGAILCKQQEFLPFYALAYLPKPQQHPTFKSMFTKQWIQQIKKQVSVYLDKLYPVNKTPTIVSMYQKFIEYNLEAEKFSSVALTQPDEDYEEMGIEEVIQENHDDSIMNNPQPVLLENANGSNRVMKNNSLQKLNFNYSNPQINYNNGQINYNNGQINSNNPQINSNNNPQSNNQAPHSSVDKQEILSLNQRLDQMQQQRAGLLSYIQNYKKKYQNLQNDFKQFSQSIKTILQQSQNKWFRIIQQLYNVALDLLNAANSIQSGIPLSDPSVLAKRKQKLQRYKGFVSMNIEDLLSDNVADYSLFERPEHDLSVDMVKKNTEYFEREQKFIQIDFAKVKSILATVPTSDMLEEDIKQLNMEKYLILQALRQRLTRMRGAFQKREVVLSYTVFDVLGINQNKKKGQQQTSIINTLLDTNNYPILLQTTLLISALCKDYYGREYLFDQKLMIKMMQIRKLPNVDDKIKEIILIIFQLQSNKRSCQVIMIDNGLMEEIVHKLDKERDQIDAFNMEYATALLLNLLLSKKGLDRAESIKSQILMTLINLMEIENSQVKNFVHASLYPLLARKSFREKALEFGMQANIKYLLQNSPSVQFEHQLKYVYNRLMMEHDQEEQKDDEPEYDEINDEQIGQDIPFMNDEVANALTGEFFLMKKYALTGPDAMQQMVQIKQQVKVTFSKAIYFERQTNERYSVQTPLLGKGRKSQIQVDKGGFTNNNSVYSNKSSNRVLRSEKNSRIKNTNNILSGEKQRLDTVQQNGSQASIKEYRQHSKGQYRNRPPKIPNQLNQNNSFEKQNTHLPTFNQKNVLQMQNAQGTFRQSDPDESPLQGSLIRDFNSININQNAKILNRQSMVEAELKRQNQEEANLRNKKLKPYEQVEEYVQAFKTRAQLVRTPPQKPN